MLCPNKREGGRHGSQNTADAAGGSLTQAQQKLGAIGTRSYIEEAAGKLGLQLLRYILYKQQYSRMMLLLARLGQDTTHPPRWFL